MAAIASRAFWRDVTGDSQLRWLGPEKGVIHMATAALVDAVWDLWAKAEGKPLWKLIVDMSPEQLVGCVDFRYLTDAITPERAVELLDSVADGREQREARDAPATASPRTRPRSGGSATATTRSASAAARPSPPAGRT